MRSRHAAALVLIAFALSCATAPATVAYRSIGAVKIAVDGGMTYYAQQDVAGKITPAQEAQVRAAFTSYTNAAAAAAAVMRASTDPAPPSLTAAADALLALLASFGVKTGVTP